MKNYYRMLILCCIGIFFFGCQQGQSELDKKIDQTLNTAVAQYSYMATQLTEGRFPKTYFADTDMLETSDSGWWCSGFYSGTMLYLDQSLGTDTFQAEIDNSLQHLEKEQFNTSTHDLGFMMFCSYGHANRLNPTPAYESILMNSAKSLATRYNKNAKAIRSWDSAPWNKGGADDLVVIIDNMMNLELLFWASKHSGDPTYAQIAVNHANTTMEHHYRDDYSSYHEVIYDQNTGAVKQQITNQGYADASSWARGQAWGLYGYVVMYRETKDVKYLEFAKHIADFIVKHPNMPKDMVPYWDFNAPDIPDALRDSSAAAIMASALLELSSYTQGAYLDSAKAMLETLLSPEYIAAEGTNGGFLLKHGVGNMPNKTEIDTPLTYGDYYLVEAMVRYKELKL